MDEILTLKEVAAFLKVAEKTVYTLAQRGDLPGFKVGDQWRFRKLDLYAWIDAHYHPRSITPESEQSRSTGTAEPMLTPSTTLDSEGHFAPFSLTIDGSYELDERQYQLRWAGTPVVLEPKAFEVLVYLIRHRDHVVTKDELLTQLWPGQIVTESSVTQCVAKARKALQLASISPAIRNVYGRGYRFILSVSESSTRQQRKREQTVPPRSQSSSANPQATDYFVRGRQYLLQFTSAALLQARHLYEQAISLDPHYAAAYAASAWTSLLEWIWLWQPEPHALHHAMRLAQQAVALDESLALAHLTLGYVSLFRGHHEQAIAETNRSLVLDPSYALAHAALAEMLVGIGKPQAALPLLEKAIRLEPHSTALFSSSLGLTYHALHRHEEALTAIRYSLTHIPNFPSARLLLAVLRSELGHLTHARKEVSTLRRLVPQFSLAGLKTRLPYQDPAEAERVVAALRKVGVN